MGRAAARGVHITVFLAFRGTFLRQAASSNIVHASPLLSLACSTVCVRSLALPPALHDMSLSFRAAILVPLH
jgi:hypothetical protein